MGTLCVLAAERRLVLHNVLNGAVGVLFDPFYKHYGQFTSKKVIKHFLPLCSTIISILGSSVIETPTAGCSPVVVVALDTVTEEGSDFSSSGKLETDT